MKYLSTTILFSLISTGTFAQKSVFQLSAKEKVRLELWYFGTDQAPNQANSETSDKHYEDLQDLDFLIEKYLHSTTISQK